MKRSGFRRPTYQGQPVTPLSDLGPGPVQRGPISTECSGEAQPKPGLWRSDRYLDYVRSLPCAIHGEGCAPAKRDASHHNRRMHGQKGAKSDDRAIPLCRRAHDYYHGKPRQETAYRLEGFTREGTEAFVEQRIRAQLRAYTGPIPDYVLARYGLEG